VWRERPPSSRLEDTATPEVMRAEASSLAREERPLAAFPGAQARRPLLHLSGQAPEAIQATERPSPRAWLGGELGIRTRPKR
jgi:hypothetical protein